MTRSTLAAALFLLTTPALGGSPQEDAMPTDTRALVGPYFELWNAADFDTAAAIVHPDFEGRTMASGQEVVRGLDGLQAWVGGVQSILPGSTKTVESVAASGDAVAVHVTMRAPHPAGGAEITASQVHWLEIRDGRIAADHVFFDMGTVIGQLSAAP